MDAFLTSLGLVTIAEMGDKTQLLALFLATRFRKPWAVVAGILAATIVNHVLTALVGVEAGDMIPKDWLKWGLGLSFVTMGLWSLIPDKLDEDEDLSAKDGRSAFVATAIAFFLAEMGDKTQVATLALAAQFKSLALVAAGTTIGMLIADVPAVFLGEKLTRLIPAKLIHKLAAALFVTLGAAILLGW